MNTDEWISKVGQWFGKLPDLPSGAREVLVKIAPWVALIFGVLGVVAALVGLGILTAFSPLLVLGGGFYAATGSLVGAILGLASSVLAVVAFPGLNGRKASGWKMMYYSEVVGAVGSLASFALGSAIVGLVIGLYILYQIKGYYK